MKKKSTYDDENVGHSLREEGKSISDGDNMSAGVIIVSAMSEKTNRL